MKNVQKKWMLFIIASAVTFLGIGSTLLKGTKAQEESDNSFFTYDIVIDADKTMVEKGSLNELKVYLDNIQGEIQGIESCTMNISFDSSILLNSKIRTLNSWNMNTGDKYIFNTKTPVTSKTAMFVIPIKVNGNGTVKLFDINCSDSINEIKTREKEIKFIILDNNLNNNQENNDTTDTEETIKSSNANLSNIILSEGSIDFDPNITEYSIEVSSFEKLIVTPILESSEAQSVIDRNILEDNNNIVITVSAENGDTKIYTIVVKESEKKDNKISNNKNVYIPIYIGIICVLVIINIIRIIKNIKKS